MQTHIEDLEQQIAERDMLLEQSKYAYFMVWFKRHGLIVLHTSFFQKTVLKHYKLKMQFSRVLFRAISAYLQLWRPVLSICNTFKMAFSTFCGFSQIAVERALSVSNMLHSVLITATSIFPTLCHYQLTCSDCHVVSLPVIMSNYL